MTGKLYICPTPIGNLDDMTIRTIKVLESVDLIAAEDTRHSLRLLNHFEIKKPLTSYHEHNKLEKGPQLIDKIIKGESIALISDAGMPGISDPGEELIALAIESGVEVVGLPGPTASMLALVLSGLSTEKFVFEGFLPSKKGGRRQVLESLKAETRTIIVYESPHRIKKVLEDIDEIYGDRRMSLSRELTKKYEEINRGTACDILNMYGDREIRGEIVLVIEGNSEVQEVEQLSDDSIRDEIKKYMEEGLSKKDAVKVVSKERNIPKNKVYQESLDI